MKRNGIANPLPARRSRVTRLTLTDPWGECDLLWRNPAMKGFPLLDTAINGWYGFRPLDGAVLDGSGIDGSEQARTAVSKLLLFYGLRSNSPASDPVARFSLSGVLVKPASSGQWKGTRRVEITLGTEGGGYAPKLFPAYTDGGTYEPKAKARAGFRTLGLIAGELDSSRPDLYSAEPLFFAFELEGMGFPCGGYRAVITEPAP
jgi:hypothetical protein